MTDLTTGIGDTGGHGFGDAVNVLAEEELIVVAVRSGCTRQAQVQIRGASVCFRTTLKPTAAQTDQ
jgi:hypothetical protein